MTVDRQLIAVLLIVLIAAALAAAVRQSRRFARYRRAISRGHYDARPVAKPFWMP
jgi:hypothetical protein